jgi:hypothetical protein
MHVHGHDHDHGGAITITLTITSTTSIAAKEIQPVKSSVAGVLGPHIHSRTFAYVALQLGMSQDVNTGVW